MSKVIDISAKIDNEPVFLHIAEGIPAIKVDDSKNTVLKIMALWDNPGMAEIEKLDETIKLALGKEAFKTIDSKNYSMSNYKKIVMAVMAAVTGEEVEEFEARFQESTAN